MSVPRSILSGLTIAAAIASGVFAETHSATLLTVTIKGEEKAYDLAALEALGPETIETSTIWTEGIQTFTGVPLWALVDDLGIDSGTLRAMAVNDYTIEIPVSDAVENGPILAYLRNGATMSVRDKGPIWVVYPYDENPKYQSEVIYSRSIWQLNRIAVGD